MPSEFTAPSSGQATALKTAIGLVGTAAGSLRTIAPAFFLYGSGAVAYADPQPAYHPEPFGIRYASALSARTVSTLELAMRHTSVEQLVIAKLDSIFEELLAAQQDLDPDDHRAIARQLWQLYK